VRDETFWLHVVPVAGDEPADMGLDPTNLQRIQFSGTVLVTKDPSDTFEEEVVAVLVSAGFDEDRIFLSSKSLTPDDDDPSLQLLVVPGVRGYRVQNRPGSSYERSAMQIVARAGTKAGSRALAKLAIKTLVNVRNTTVTV